MAPQTSKQLKQSKQSKASQSYEFYKKNLFKPNLSSKPYFGFGSLEEGEHEIVTFRFARNRFYDSKTEGSLKRNLIAELEDQIVFLPAIIARNFDDNDDLLEEINNDGIKRFLRFGGRKNG